MGSGAAERSAEGVGGYPGEAVDRLAVKDQSEKQRRKFKRARGAQQTHPAAPLIILRSINVSLFIYLFIFLFIFKIIHRHNNLGLTST